MTLRAKTLSGFRWIATARLASQLVTWAFTLVVIRLLEPQDYGLLAMATVFVSFLTMFSEFGLGAAIVQKNHIGENLLREIFGIVLLIHFLLAIALTILAPYIAAFYDEPRVTLIIQVMATQFILAGFAVIPDAQLQRKMEFRNRSLLDLSGAIVGSSCTLILAYSDKGVWSLVLGALLSQAWRTIGINWLAPFLHWPKFTFQELGSLVRFGWNITGAQICWFVFYQADTLICAKLLGNEVLGYYSVAMHLASLPTTKISGLINQIAFPVFSRIQDNLQKIGEIVLSATRMLSIISIPLLWGISSISREIVELILGAKWSSSTQPIAILALVIPLRMIGGIVYNAIQGIGRSDIILKNAIWSLLLSPPIFFFGAQTGGLIGLCLAWLVVSPFASFQGMIRGLPALGLRFSQFIRTIFPASCAGLFMYVVIEFLRSLALQDLTPEIRLPILITTGSVVYCGTIATIDRKGTREILAMMKSIMTAKSEN